MIHCDNWCNEQVFLWSITSCFSKNLCIIVKSQWLSQLPEPDYFISRATGPRNPRFELRSDQWFFPWTRKLINFARWSSSLATLVGPKPHHGSLPSRLKGASQTTQLWKRIYLRGVYTNQETAAHAVVGSIVCAFRRLKKSRRREMSARSYKFHSVCFRIFFLLRAWLYTRPLISNIFNIVESISSEWMHCQSWVKDSVVISRNGQTNGTLPCIIPNATHHVLSLQTIFANTKMNIAHVRPI